MQNRWWSGSDNNQALAVIHEALEDKILTVGRMVITNKWSITSAT